MYSLANSAGERDDVEVLTDPGVDGRGRGASQNEHGGDPFRYTRAVLSNPASGSAARAGRISVAPGRKGMASSREVLNLQPIPRSRPR